MKKFLLICLSIGAALNAWSQCDELFISEYVEGSRNNKALEIYNPTGSTIDLSKLKKPSISLFQKKIFMVMFPLLITVWNMTTPIFLVFQNQVKPM